MTKYIIPLEKLPNQTIKVELNKKNCALEFVSRGGHVYLNKFDIEDETVLSGIICLNETNILHLFGTKEKLYFKDLNGKEDPVYTGFNDRFILYYEDENV